MTTELTEDEWREATTYDLIDWHRAFSTEGERDAAWGRFLARVKRDAKAEAWDEAYRRGVDDARLADDLRVDVGLGPDLYAQPARQNPYRDTPCPEEAQ